MPYREGKKWRATPKYKGQRLPQKTFNTKREAAKWEREQKRLAKKAERISQGGLDLLTFCSKYKLYSQRFSAKTSKEKAALCEQILEEFGPDKPVHEITTDEIQTYLDTQAGLRSANAANKDRKNLSAMWTYGEEILDLKSNPITKTKKHTHDLAPQETYTEDEILKLLMASDRYEKLIISLFLESAGRRMEVFKLKLSDVNIEKRGVQLWTRKNRDGTLESEWLPITENLADELKWWLENRPMKESIWLFPNPRTGKPYVDPRKILFRICDQAKVRKLGYHAFRRYVASILDDKYKASRKSIQKLLRHKKEATTERYLYQIHSDLRDMAGLAVPKEKVPEDSTPNEKEVNDKNR